MNDSLLLYNGTFYRFGTEPAYRWLWVRGGIICDAGFGSGYYKYRAQAGESLDLKGNLALPGFCDCRVHMVQTALKNREVDLHGADSFEEVGRRIRSWMQAHPRAGLVRAYGLEVSDLKEKRLPDRRAIDRMVRECPVWISSRDFHRSMLNTKALYELNVPLAVNGVETDGEQHPTGILQGTANALVRSRIFRECSDEDKSRALEQLAQDMIRKGITSVHAMEGGWGFAESDARLLWACAPGLPVDVSLYFGTMQPLQAKEMGLARIGGDIFVDGSFASRNAALAEPYSDSDHSGQLNYAQEELNAFLLQCYRFGLRTALHAVGERAMEQVLAAHQYAREATGIFGMRHRVEHAELCTTDQMRRAKALGLIFSMQPACEILYGGRDGMYAARLGARAQRTNPLRKIIDSGITICGGSDSDLTPLDPIGGIYAAVCHPQPESAVSVEEAVRMFTLNGAYAEEEEGKKGQLEVGMRADIAVLDRNIFQIAAADIAGARTVATVKDGAVLFEAL